MKRYGDNLPSSEKIEELDTPQSVQVMYGGCGVRFGTFTQKAIPSKKHKTFDILALLGFKRRKKTPSVQ
jgi:hypothetical protein